MIKPVILSGAALAGIGLLAAAGFAADTKPAPITQEQAAFFESKIRPILFNNCFSCHGEKEQKGGLRLDSMADLQKGNASGPAVIAGDPDKSPLIRAIRYSGKVKMPPAGQLKPEEIAALAEWIKKGAQWPEAKPVTPQKPDYVITEKQRSFWSFRPVKKPALPAVKNSTWVKTPIDRFILAGLEAKGLKPAPAVDRRSLIRRAYFDLIGLPPTPEEVEAFIADKSPTAFAKVVDHLLASPHYGERWGRQWLDVARYADSNGLDENKAFAHAYHYRDYVIAAYNKDKPYDLFIKEQLAGDLLRADTDALRNEHITATGFLVLGPKVLAEQDKPKFVMDIVDEQIEVTTKAFMGLTVACARCHDHKFDPIPTKDYYALAGIFKSTKTMKDLGFVSNWNERTLLGKADSEHLKKQQAELEKLQTAVKDAHAAADKQLQDDIHQNADKYLKAAWELSRQPGMISIADTPIKAGDPERIIIEAEKFNRGNVIKDFDGYGKGIGIILNINTPDEVEWDINVPSAGLYQVELRYASAEARPVRLLLNGKIIRTKAAGEITGSFNPDGQRWEAEGAHLFNAGKNVLRIECDIPIPHFDKILVVAARGATVANAAPRSPEEIAGQFGVNPELVKFYARRLVAVSSEADFEALRKTGEADLLKLPKRSDPFYSAASKETLTKATEAVNALKADMQDAQMVMAVEEDKPVTSRVHIRGNTLTLGDDVPRHFVTIVSTFTPPKIDEKNSGRLEMAEWLTNPNHPLTSRVAVNRIWQGHFGEAMVRTPDNWGFLGDKPANPQLLDWLASTFMEQGWSMKKMHRLIMLSSAYQMSCAVDPKAELADPENRLQWHMNRRRLEAEPFRDAMLAVSGQLDETMGGSLLVSKNNDYVTNDQSGNAAQYNTRRRTVYLPIIRNALYDMLQAFDVGDPSIVNAKRATTTVAPQALWVMNSPFALEQSKALATDLLSKTTMTDTDRIKLAYLKMYSRPPAPEEITRATSFVNAYFTKLEKTEPDAQKRKLRAWQSLCQILFASNEFIYLN
jgi:mono/diheme cytochrome c family protein